MIDSILQDQNPWWFDPLARRPASRPWRRPLVTAINAALRRDDRRAILLCGPRQVGKTVCLLQAVEALIADGVPPQQIAYFDFSDDRLIAAVSPRDVLAAAPVVPGSRFVFLDEITACAGPWDLWLKQAVDEGGARIVATDSSASLLRGPGRESGLGRWDEWPIGTLTFAEWVGLRGLGEDPEAGLLRDPRLLAVYLQSGGFPEFAYADSDLGLARRRLRSDLMDKAVRRDLARLRLSPELARVFAYLAESSSAEVVPAKVACELALDRRTVESGLQAFVDAGLLLRLDRFTARASERLRAPTKVHATDHGIVAAFSALADPFGDARTKGALYEAVVLRHLRSLAPGTGDIAYYREDKTTEVDFVVKLPGGAATIEVTSSVQVDGPKLRTTAAVRETIGARTAIVVHGGVTEAWRDGVHLLPLHRFLCRPERIAEVQP